MSNVDFDQYADRYNDLLREQTAFVTSQESYFAKYKVDVARRLLPRPPSRVLEFGCGIGRNLPFLVSAFPDARIAGCDPSARSIEIARAQNHGVDLWPGEPPADVQPFDLVFVAGVLHHVPVNERSAVVGRLAAQLAGGGTCIVFEHNPYNPVTRRIVRDCPFDEGVVLLKASEVGRHLARAGLSSIRRGYTLFLPPWRWLRPLSRLESMLAWLPAGGQYWVSAQKA